MMYRDRYRSGSLQNGQIVHAHQVAPHQVAPLLKLRYKFLVDCSIVLLLSSLVLILVVYMECTV